MVIKKWVAISYCFAFISVYFCYLAYATSTLYINKTFNTNIPQTESMNATASMMMLDSASGGLASWSEVLIVVIVAIVAILILLSFRSMDTAY